MATYAPADDFLRANIFATAMAPILVVATTKIKVSAARSHKFTAPAFAGLGVVTVIPSILSSAEAIRLVKQVSASR
ncbi:hypothetical protein LRC484719_00220 [Mycobacterium riyadhense]